MKEKPLNMTIINVKILGKVGDETLELVIPKHIFKDWVRKIKEGRE
jgi:hypothetical protein